MSDPATSEQMPAGYCDGDDACRGHERGDIGNAWPVIDVLGPCRSA